MRSLNSTQSKNILKDYHNFGNSDRTDKTAYAHLNQEGAIIFSPVSYPTVGKDVAQTAIQNDIVS